MNQNKIDPDKINLLNIKTVKGNIDGSSELEPGQITGHQVTFEVKWGMDSAQNIIGVLLSVFIQAIDSNGTELDQRGSYTHELVFRIQNLEDFIKYTEPKEGEKVPEVDYLLVSTLVSISISTVRGIVFSRTQGTSLGSVILPIVDPKKFLEPVNILNEEK